MAFQLDLTLEGITDIKRAREELSQLKQEINQGGESYDKLNNKLKAAIAELDDQKKAVKNLLQASQVYSKHVAGEYRDALGRAAAQSGLLGDTYANLERHLAELKNSSESFQKAYRDQYKLTEQHQSQLKHSIQLLKNNKDGSAALTVALEQELKTQRDKLKVIADQESVSSRMSLAVEKQRVKLEELSTAEAKELQILKAKIKEREKELQLAAKAAIAPKPDVEQPKLSEEDRKRAEEKKRLAEASIRVAKALEQQKAKLAELSLEEAKSLAHAKVKVEIQEQELRKAALISAGYDSQSRKVKALSEQLQFYSTAQGKAYLADKRREAQLLKQIRQTEQLALKTKNLNQRVMESSKLLGQQSTAAFRAGSNAAGSHIGIFTSSTILTATGVYGVIAAFREMIATGAEFEANMDRVNAIMSDSARQSAILEANTRGLAETTVYTATEVSQGMIYLGMAGMTTEEALAAIHPTLRLASIGMLDMGTSADIVTNIMVGFGLENSRIAEVVDDMATAVTSSNMDIQQLGNAMSYVAPLARDADISLQEVVASLEVLHNTGIKSSRAGTAMRTSMLSLLAPTKQAQAVLDKYGITIDDNSGKMRNWTTILKEFANANITLEDVKNLIGKRQAAPFKALVDSAKEYKNELGEVTTVLEEFTEAQYTNAGAAEKMQQILEDNLRGDWKKLLSAIEEKYLQFYDNNREQFRYMVQSVTDFVKSLDVDRLNQFYQTFKNMVSEAVKLYAALKGAQALGGIGAVVGTGVGGPLGTAVGTGVGWGIGAVGGYYGAEYGIESLLSGVGLDESSEPAYIANARRKYDALNSTTEELYLHLQATEAAIADVDATLGQYNATLKHEQSLTGVDRQDSQYFQQKATQVNTLKENLRRANQEAEALRRLLGERGFQTPEAISSELASLNAAKRSQESALASGALGTEQAVAIAKAYQQTQERITELLDRQKSLKTTLNNLSNNELTREQELKSEKENAVNLARKEAEEYYRLKTAAESITSDKAKLASYNKKIAEGEAEIAKYSKEGEGSYGKVKQLSEALLKLVEKRVALQNRMNAANSRAADKEKQKYDQALKVAEKGNLSSLKSLEALKKSVELIEYKNTLAEQGILFTDDELFKRQQGILALEKELAIATRTYEEAKQQYGLEDKITKERKAQVENLEKELSLQQNLTTQTNYKYQQLLDQVSLVSKAYSGVDGAIKNIWDNGAKSAGEAIKSISDSFKQLIKDLLYQAYIKPIVVRFVADTSKLMGVNGGVIDQFVKGQGMTPSSLANVSSITNLLPTGITSLGSKFATSQLGYSLGLSAPTAAPTSAFQAVNYPGPLTPTSTGNFLTSSTGSFGNMLAGAGAGIAGGFLANSLGLGGEDGAVGGSVLGMAGMALAGPLGAFVGSFLGSMIGGKPSDKTQWSNFDLDTYDVISDGFGGKKYSEANRTAATSMAQQFATFSKFLENKTGTDLGGGLRVTVGDRDGLRLFYSDSGKWDGDPGTEGAVVTSNSTAEFVDQSARYLAEQAGLVTKVYDLLADSEESLLDSVSRVETQFSALDAISSKAGLNLATFAGNIEGTFSAEELARIGADNIADILFEELRAEGENTAQTVVRAASEFVALNDLLTNTKDTLGLTGIEAIKASTGLIELVGGLESFTNIAQSYYQNFIPESERIITSFKTFKEQFAELNLSLPESREGFRQLVEGLDLSSDAGRKTYADLLLLSSAASDYYSQLESWTENFKDSYKTITGFEASAKTVAYWMAELESGAVTFEQAMEAITASVKGVTPEISVDQLTLTNLAIVRAAEGYEQQYQNTMEAIKAQEALDSKRIRLEGQLVEQISRVLNSLKLGNISPLTPQQKLLEAQQKFAASLVKVESGDLGEASNLAQGAQAYLDQAASYYASSGPYLRIFDDVTSALEALQGKYDIGLSTDSRLEQLTASIEASQLAAASTLNSQLFMLTRQYDSLESIQDLLDLLPEDLATSIRDILKDNGIPVSGSPSGSSGSGSTSPRSTSIRDVLASEYNVHKASSDLVRRIEMEFIRMAHLGSSSVPDAVNTVMNSSYGQSYLHGSHAKGHPNIPFDGYRAELHKSEMVLPAEIANSIRRNYSDDSRDIFKDMVSEIRELKAELQSLKKMQAELSGLQISEMKEQTKQMKSKKSTVRVF